jgi:hypothetical protein
MNISGATDIITEDIPICKSSYLKGRQYRQNIVTGRIKAEIADPEKTSIATQRYGKHFSALVKASIYSY